MGRLQASTSCAGLSESPIVGCCGGDAGPLLCAAQVKNNKVVLAKDPAGGFLVRAPCTPCLT